MTSKRKWWHLGRAAPAPVSRAHAIRTPPALTAPELVEAPAARAFKAARPGRLAGGFGFLGAPGVSSRDETRRDLRGLLAHARYAAQNIDYVRSYK